MKIITVTKNRKYHLGCALSILLAAVPTMLQADTVPLGYTAAIVELYDQTGQVCVNSDVNTALCSVNGSTAGALVANANGGIASVKLGNTATAGLAVTEYYFGIEGPTTENVPIIIHGFVNTQDSAQADSYSFAEYFMYQGSPSGATYSLNYFASPNTCAYLILSEFPCRSSGSFDINTTVSSNSAFFVYLGAVAAGTNASALIDPTISIDPSFADASEFTLVSNAGVFAPAAPSVPEPGPVGLLGLGGCVMAAGLRRLRNSVDKRNSRS